MKTLVSILIFLLNLVLPVFIGLILKDVSFTRNDIIDIPLNLVLAITPSILMLIYYPFPNWAKYLGIGLIILEVLAFVTVVWMVLEALGGA